MKFFLLQIIVFKLSKKNSLKRSQQLATRRETNCTSLVDNSPPCSRNKSSSVPLQNSKANQSTKPSCVRASSSYPGKIISLSLSLSLLSLSRPFQEERQRRGKKQSHTHTHTQTHRTQSTQNSFHRNPPRRMIGGDDFPRNK